MTHLLCMRLMRHPFRFVAAAASLVVFSAVHAQTGSDGSTAESAFTLAQMEPHYASGTRCYTAKSQTLYKDHCYAFQTSYVATATHFINHGLGSYTQGSCMFSFVQNSQYDDLYAYRDVLSTWLADYAVKCLEDHPGQGYNAAEFVLEGYDLHMVMSGLPASGSGLPEEITAS